MDVWLSLKLGLYLFREHPTTDLSLQPFFLISNTSKMIFNNSTNKHMNVSQYKKSHKLYISKQII